MIDAFEKKVSGNEWLWQEVPMSHWEGMLEHVALSNTSAVVVERYEQDDPFGKSHTLDASGNNLGNFASQVHHHKRMHGGVVESVTGLYDFRNRWYSPESGAWLSRDPLGQVDSENLYQFARAASILRQDTFGLTSRPGYTGYPAGGVWISDGIPVSQEGCDCPCDKTAFDTVKAEFLESCDSFNANADMQNGMSDAQKAPIVAACDFAKNKWSYGGCVSCWEKGGRAEAVTPTKFAYDGSSSFCCAISENTDAGGNYKSGNSCEDIMRHELGNHGLCMAVGGRPSHCTDEYKGDSAGHLAYDGFIDIMGADFGDPDFLDKWSAYVDVVFSILEITEWPD